MKRRCFALVLLLGSLATIVALVAQAWLTSDTATDRAYAALGGEPISAGQLQETLDDVLPVYLLILHSALSRGDETATYNILSSVTHGAALDTAFAARTGTLAMTGLPHGNGKIHEIDLLSADVIRQGDELSVLAVWQVIGLVSQTEHTHVRGGTFGAAVTLAPAEGMWKITRFVPGAPGQNLADLRGG